jgi:hypothetical protein
MDFLRSLAGGATITGPSLSNDNLIDGGLLADSQTTDQIQVALRVMATDIVE